MPSLQVVEESNARIATELPAGMVAVFAGSTSGIGEYAMVQFAKHAVKPRIYFVGRSQEAADRIISQMKSLNAEGTYVFLKKDTAIIKNVDEVCNDIKSKESTISLLHLSTGTLNLKGKTEEGLKLSMALTVYSRNRFVQNLLPLLQAASSLRRVVSVFAGTKEGQVDLNDLEAKNTGFLAYRGHAASLVTFSLEALAKKAPDVSFVHDFPGHVRSNIIRGGEGAIMQVLKVVGKVLGPLGTYVPDEESGNRHVFYATSAMYPAKADGEKTAGVSLQKGQAVAKGTTGEAGSGVYTADAGCEGPPPTQFKLYNEIRDSGAVDKIWANQEEVFMRLTGSQGT